MCPGRRRRRIPSLLPSLLLGFLLAVPAAAELPERVRQIARTLDVPAEDISVWVQPVGGKQPLLTHLPDRPRSPASPMKLVTTFAALQGLTPAFRWETEIHALGPVEKGVLKGNLLLRGHGDPYLVTGEYWDLINGVRQAGIRRVEGDLVFDTSYFELPEEDPGAFDGRPDRVYNMPPHPLLVNFNAVRFRFMPDSDGGVEVMTEPELPNVAIDNRLGLARHGCYGYQRGVALNVVDTESERDRVMLEGRFPSGCERYGMTRTVLRPESYAFGLFDVYWRQLGGELTGRWRLGTLPKDLVSVDPDTGAPLPDASESLIHVHRSRPLGDIVRLVNKYSNNVMTRHLQLTLGAERFGPPATEPKGNRAIREILEEQGVSLEGLLIDNPSGLSRTAQLSARQLGTLLRAAWEAPFMPEFVSSLSLSGLDGTLRNRLGDGPERGRMHLKTGTMDEVSAIAGYVQAADGGRHVVAILINSPLADRGPGEEIQDALLRWVHDR